MAEYKSTYTGAEIDAGITKANTAIQDVSDKQDVLVSGTNIKTINNQSLLGSGNIDVSGGESFLTEETISTGGDIPVTGLTLDYNSLNLTPNQEIRIACSVTPPNATDTRINWSSSNSNIATVVDGLVKGISQGNATITAQSVSNTEITANCSVTVTGSEPITPTGITLSSSSLSGNVGESGNLIATLSPSGATGTIVWSSSDTNIATVNNGVVNYIAVGTATITATVSGTALSDICSVTVSAAPQPATKVYLADLTPTGEGKILNVDGTSEYSTSDGNYWEIPYIDGMYVVTGMNAGWISNYPPFILKSDGSVIIPEYNTGGSYYSSTTKYDVTLSGYDNDTKVYVNTYKLMASSDYRQYVYYEAGGNE